MRSEELAAESSMVNVRCIERIMGVGKSQYEFTDGIHTMQDFEVASEERMRDMVLEEIEDTINHLVMLHIRVRRVSEEANRYAARQRSSSAQ